MTYVVIIAVATWVIKLYKRVYTARDEAKEADGGKKAEQEKVLERRDRFRRAYEQRVKSGAQRKYYERTKTKSAQYNADKAALLDESYTLGANALAPQN